MERNGSNSLIIESEERIIVLPIISYKLIINLMGKPLKIIAKIVKLNYMQNE